MSYAEDKIKVREQLKSLRFFEASCGDKIRYGSQKKADAKIVKMGHKGLHSYLCEFCGFWHIGHLMQGK